MPAAEAAWKVSVPEAVPGAAVRSIALFCLGAITRLFPHEMPCRR